MDYVPGSLATRADLLQSGLTDAQILASLKQGDLARIRHGVYGSVEDRTPEEEHRRLIEATMRRLDAPAALSHQSAGILHGLPVPRSELGRVAVTRAVGHGYVGEHLRVHGAKLHDSEITTVDGFSTTTVTRTAVDLARVLEEPWALAACDAALRGGLTKEELLRATTLHGKLRGLPTARRLILLADGRSESPAESYSRWQMLRSGIPMPVPQFNVYDADGNWVARCDYGWEEYKLVGEVDGAAKYGSLLKPGQTSEMAVRDEKRREEGIRDAGYEMVRWDLALAMLREQFVARLRRAIHRQQKRGFGV